MNAMGVGSQNEVSGRPVLDASFLAAAEPQWPRISTEFSRAEARSVKSTGWPAFWTENVVVTGWYVPAANDGIATLAFAASCNVID